MPFDANGNFTLVQSYFVETGNDVLPVQHNPPFEDIAAALNQVMLRSGGSAMLGNLNMNGFRAVNLANGTQPQDAATVSQLQQSTPIGAVIEYAGVNAPPTWMFAAGQEVSRTQYAALWVAMGSPNTGNGSTTFNLPDYRGRVGVGRDDMGGTAANRITQAVSGINANTLGASGGSQSHLLTLAQIPAHDHGGDTGDGGTHTHTATAAGGHNHGGASGAGGTHTHTGTAASAGSHDHDVPYDNGGSGSLSAFVRATGSSVIGYLKSVASGLHTHSLSIVAAPNHTHTISTDGSHTHPISTVPNHKHDIPSAGGGAAHNNLQPLIVTNYIIKVSV